MAEANQPDSSPPGARDSLFDNRYPEATTSAIVFGLVFGVLMTMAITYAGLKIGFTILGSAIAAVVGFGVLRGLLGKGSILEVNISQTIASAVNSASPGIIFTVPVLYLLKQEMTLERFVLITLAGMVGSVLGVAFIVPLRKQMVDIDRLRFPSGTAVAVILKSPGAGPRKSLVLLIGVLVAAAIYLFVELPNIPTGGARLPGYADLNLRLADPRPDRAEPLPRSLDRDSDGKTDLIVTNKDIDLGRAIGLPDYALLVFAITPLSFGAGYLTGRAGLMVLAGGILAFFVLNPIAYALGWLPPTLHADQVPDFAYANLNRPLGIGILLGGAFMGVVAALPAIRAALKSIGSAGGKKQSRDEMSLRSLVLIIVIAVTGLYFAANLIAGRDASDGLLADLDPYLRNALIAIIGAAWIWFAGIIVAQCTGMTDWSPVSGMALLTVVLVMLLAGRNEVGEAVMLGAALCVAIAAASDMMTDLKTGYLVGAQPRRQQMLEIGAALLGPIISMCTLMAIVERNLIQTDGRLPLGPGTETVAPQAQALQAVITGMQGDEMPYALYGFGALLGVLLGLGAFPGLVVLVGLSMYLPIKYVLTYGLGCLANMAVTRIKGKVWAEEWGVPFCAGLVVGEAMLAMIVNMLIIGISLAG
jgi:uncharacterized oligopeptide transporter (OPT) family protein